MTPNARRLAATYSLALLAAVIAPIRQNWRPKPRKDGFPLSYYPMFSAKRPSTAIIYSLIGVAADGARIRLPHHIGGTGGLNQVRRQINRCVAEGRSQQVCEFAARELTRRNRRDNSPYLAIVSVDVVASRFRLDECFSGAGLVGKETVLASMSSLGETARSA